MKLFGFYIHQAEVSYTCDKFCCFQLEAWGKHFSWLLFDRVPGAANSLSEGEAVLSPGDACWYSTYASKMGRWAGTESKGKDGQTSRRKGEKFTGYVG